MVGRRTSEDRLNRPKTVYFRLPASTYAYIRPLSREERRKSAAERPKASSLKPGSPIFGLSRPNNARRSLTCAREAGLYRAFAVYLRVLVRTFAYLRSGNVSIARGTSENRPPAMVHWSGLNRVKKRGRLEAIQDDNRADQKID